MSNKYFVGQSVNSIETSKALLPFTKVVIIVGEDGDGNQVVYEAGNDNGRTLEVTNPWGTQAIANDMLARISGYAYKPFSANGAFVPDVAELGDGVTVNGIYSVLAGQDLNFDTLSTSDIEASGEDETANEFGIYKDSTQKNLQRSVNKLTTTFTVELGKIESEIYDPSTGVSRITQNSEAIIAEVQRASGAESLIAQRADSIRLSVSSANGSSTFTLTDNSGTLDTKTLNLTVDAVNVSGTLTASQIDATNLQVSAANVTGQLTASQINTTGLVAESATFTGGIRATSVALDDSNGQIAGTMLLTGSTSVPGARKIYMESAAIELHSAGGDLYFASAAAAIQIKQAIGEISVRGRLVANSDGVYDLGIQGNAWRQVWATDATIHTSDRNKKKDIVYGLEEYDALFDSLKPCHFKFKGSNHDRVHMGMIAQDVEDELTACKIDTMDMGSFVKSWNEAEQDYDYALRYTEFVPLLIWEVQQLKTKVKELTA